MAGAILATAEFLANALVLTLDFRIGDRVLLEVFLHVGAYQHALALEFDARRDFGQLGKPQPSGLLGHDLAIDEFVAHRLAQLRVVGAALGGKFLDHRVDARHRDGHAVDLGEILGYGGAACGKKQRACDVAKWVVHVRFPREEIISAGDSGGFVRCARDQRKSVNLAMHQGAERVIDKAMPRDARPAFEVRRHDGEAVMAASGGGSSVSGVRRAVVGQFQDRWFQQGQSTPNAIFRVGGGHAHHSFGSAGAASGIICRYT